MTPLSAVAKERGLSAGLLFRLEAALLALVCFSAPGVPRLVPLVLGFLAAVAAIHVFTVDRARPLKFLSTGVSLALLAFTAYLFINATWAPDRAQGVAKAATVLGLIVAVVLLGASYSLRDKNEARVLAKWALVGLICGLGFLLIEITFDEAIARFVNNHIVQVFTLSPKKMKIVAGEVTEVAPFELNRNAASLVLLLLPGLLFIGALATTTARRLSFVVLIMAAAVAVLFSQSGTSVVAFFVGGLVLALGAFSLKATRRLLAVGWTVATLLAVPLGALPYELGWHHWTWLPPESVAARFYIWKYVADRVYEKPITGIGIRGTRALHLHIPTDQGDPSHAAYALKGREPRHPHNIYLQTWLELGAIGAVLLLGVGLAALWQIRLLPPMLEASAYALFAASAMIGLSGFDLFQTWLLAALAFAWAGIMLAARLPAPPFLARIHPCDGRDRKAVSPEARA
jgi:O-Antigen ligase